MWSSDPGRPGFASLLLSHQPYGLCSLSEVRVHVCRASSAVLRLSGRRVPVDWLSGRHSVPSMPWVTLHHHARFTDGKTEAQSTTPGCRRHTETEAVLVIMNWLFLGFESEHQRL